MILFDERPLTRLRLSSPPFESGERSPPLFSFQLCARAPAGARSGAMRPWKGSGYPVPSTAVFLVLIVNPLHPWGRSGDDYPLRKPVPKPIRVLKGEQNAAFRRFQSAASEAQDTGYESDSNTFPTMD